MLTGVGKANAAGAVAATLTHGPYAAVLSLGFAGALPNESPAEIGQTLLADHCVLADDGLLGADAFVPQTDLGFPAVEGLGERFPVAPALADALGRVTDRTGPCATVSACSGTDAAAAEIARRTNALAEDMESAAVGLAAARLGVPFAAVRVISNRTGARERQGWDIDRAAAALTAFVAAL